MIRSLPVPSRDVLRAKLEAHVVLSAPAVVFCGIVLWWAVGAEAAMGILVLAVPLLFLVCTGAWGLAMNLLLPRLDWVSETEPVKQGAATLLAMLGSFTLAAAIAVPYPLWLRQWMIPEIYLGCWLVAMAVMTVGLLRWIDTAGVRRFEEL